MNWKTHYQQAHAANFIENYPSAWKDGHYTPPKYPDPTKTNGLTQIVQNFLTWSGHYANRINVSGRQIGGFTRTAAGNIFDDRKWIKSSTKKGSSDLFCTIAGKTVCIEIKNEATKDKIRPDQEKEKQRVEKSGGTYVIVTNADQFFEWYESFTEQIKKTA
jgi:hypothetical protein